MGKLNHRFEDSLACGRETRLDHDCTIRVDVWFHVTEGGEWLGGPCNGGLSLGRGGKCLPETLTAEGRKGGQKDKSEYDAEQHPPRIKLRGDSVSQLLHSGHSNESSDELRAILDRPIKRNCRSKWRNPVWDESAAQTLAVLHSR
jgi:hypothetical protein